MFPEKDIITNVITQCYNVLCVCYQMLMGTSLPVTTLVKVKEGLLRQRELEIDRYLSAVILAQFTHALSLISKGDYRGIGFIIILCKTCNAIETIK